MEGEPPNNLELDRLRLEHREGIDSMMFDLRHEPLDQLQAREAAAVRAVDRLVEELEGAKVTLLAITDTIAEKRAQGQQS